MSQNSKASALREQAIAAGRQELAICIGWTMIRIAREIIDGESEKNGNYILNSRTP